MKCLDVVPQSNFKAAIKRNNPDVVISISDPQIKAPYILRLLTIPKLVLKFEDFLDADQVNAPTKDHVQQIIDFALQHKGKSFVVHCFAGQCRSSAAAIISEVATGRPVDAIMEDLTIRYVAIHPNSLMLKYAQEILGIDFMTDYFKFDPLWRHKRAIYFGYGTHGIYH